MESGEWPTIILKINDFCSIKGIECYNFTLRGEKCSLFLEQNVFSDTSRDCFSLKLKCPNVTSAKTFSVSTFIKDKFDKLCFLQCKKVTFRYRHVENTEVWTVRRKDILDKWNSLLCDPVTLGVFCGPFDYTILQYSVQESHHADEKGNEVIQSSFQTDNSACLEILSRDFHNLFNDHKESDTTIKCEDCTFPVHKAILSSRSEVFAAMFRNDMLEKRNGFVTITDLDPSVLKQLLHYIYTGTVTDLTYDTALLLYSTAHKYAIAALQMRCAQFMTQNLSESNACKCLLLADTCSDSDFKDSVISYIIEKKTILKSEEWLKLCEDQMKLSNEVYREYFKKES